MPMDNRSYVMFPIRQNIDQVIQLVLGSLMNYARQFRWYTQHILCFSLAYSDPFLDVN